MQLINRGFISVKPSSLFIEWLKSYDSAVHITAEDAEATVYLIEEEFWDDDLILKSYAKKIATSAFAEYGCDEAHWPSHFDIENFEHWFDFDLGCTCIDLLAAPIQKEPLS